MEKNEIQRQSDLAETTKKTSNQRSRKGHTAATTAKRRRKHAEGIRRNRAERVLSAAHWQHFDTQKPCNGSTKGKEMEDETIAMAGEASEKRGREKKTIRPRTSQSVQNQELTKKYREVYKEMKMQGMEPTKCPAHGNTPKASEGK